MTQRRLFRAPLRVAAAVLLCLILSTTVFADMGPHRSVRITVEMPEGQRPFYATLLSKYPSTGPYSVDNWKSEYPKNETYRRFADYADPDGYYFISFVEYCTDGSFAWGYMPPNDFKLLLFFPDTGELVCSEAATAFAFDSVYRATLRDGKLELEPVHDYLHQLWTFLARLAVTLLIELGLALLFGYRLRPVLRINLITQILLNVLLALTAHSMGSGGFFFVFFYLILELLVFSAEALYYVCRLPGINEAHPGKGRAVAYAFLANALSFGAGLLLISLWPLAF